MSRRLPFTNDGSRMDELRQAANALLDAGFTLREVRDYAELVILERLVFRAAAREWFSRKAS